jgi:magnesium and cobalt transporter
MSEERPSSPSKSWLDKLSTLFADDPSDRQDLKEVLREAAERNVVDSETLSTLEGALQISDMQVRDIMVPRSQMVCIKAEDSIKKFLPSVIESAHSRFPVLGEDKDEVLGVLLAKDLLPLIINEQREDFNITDILRSATFVPESKRLNILLKEFRATRNHMAIVADEFGGIAGIVTIEDVLEQIVGEIEDEHDQEDDDSFIKKLDHDVRMVKALTPIEDFNEHFNTKFNEKEFDTIAGFVVQHFGRVPECDEAITINKWRFKIVNGNARRINLMEVTPIS